MPTLFDALIKISTGLAETGLLLMDSTMRAVQGGIESLAGQRPAGPLTLGQGSQDASLSEGLQWAVTPKLTMIAGRQLSIEGRFRCEAPSSIQQ